VGAKIGLRGPRDDSDFSAALVNGAICAGSDTEGRGKPRPYIRGATAPGD